jgi:hypothetical protein
LALDIDSVRISDIEIFDGCLRIHWIATVELDGYDLNVGFGVYDLKVDKTTGKVKVTAMSEHMDIDRDKKLLRRLLELLIDMTSIVE